jgi:hypothetical protein
LYEIHKNMNVFHMPDFQQTESDVKQNQTNIHLVVSNLNTVKELKHYLSIK